jgi:hypothetical protein
MGALKDLWQSERGMVAVALIVACTVLCAISTIDVDQWLAYTKFIFVAYAAAKTVTGTAVILNPPKPADPPSDMLGAFLSSFTKTFPQPKPDPKPDPTSDEPPGPGTVPPSPSPAIANAIS